MIRTIVAALLASALATGMAQAQGDGEQLYQEHCASCHGEKLQSTGSVPDLRQLGDNDRARFDAMVQEGRGQMPAWQGVLSPQEIDDIWGYIRANAG